VKIKYTTGPRAGETEHVENNVGRFAVAAGLATEVGGEIRAPGEPPYALPKPGAAPAPTPKFEVTEYVGVTRRYLAIKMSILANTTFFTGNPKAIKLVGGWPVPDDIRRDYAKQWERHPDLRDPLATIPELSSGANERAASELAQRQKADIEEFHAKKQAGL